MRVLVMMETWSAALTCIQSFGRRRHEVAVLTLGGVLSPNARSSFVRAVFRLKLASIAESATELASLVKRHRIDLVVPISDRDAEIVALAKANSPDTTAFVTSSPEAVAITRNRNRTIDLCRSVGVATPRSRATSRDALATDVEGFGTPCFVKVSGSAASSGVFRVETPEAAHELQGQLAGVEELQLQEEIVGDFVDVTGFAYEGKVVRDFAFSCDYEDSLEGPLPYSRLERAPALSETFAKIVAALKWTGGLDIDLLQPTQGPPVVLEINPRLSGQTTFAYKLGIDLPADYAAAVSRNPRFAPVKPLAADAPDTFITLLEEARRLSKREPAQLAKAVKIRSERRRLDDGFWDDAGYSAALYAATEGLLFY
jgi:glutathione synthase/RimK-type ligase-like ATP-grasp enzyme